MIDRKSEREKKKKFDFLSRPLLPTPVIVSKTQTMAEKIKR